MSIVKMKRVTLIGLDEVKRDLIRELMDYGMLEITDETKRLQDEISEGNLVKEDTTDYINTLQRRIDSARGAIEAIDRYGELKSPLFATRRHVNHEMLHKIAQDVGKTEAFIESIHGLESAINRGKDELNRLEQYTLSLKPWSEYEIPLEVTETEKTDVLVGFVPIEADLNAMETELGENVLVREVSFDKENRFITVTSLKDEANEVQAALKQFGFNRLSFKDFKGTAKSNLDSIGERIIQVREDIERVKDKIKAKAKGVTDVENYYDMMNIYLDREKVKANLVGTKRTFMASGWAPERATVELKSVLENNGCYYQFRDPEDDEEVPVLLSNPSFFQPTEAITEMYSLPDYRGFDPTSIYSLFYIIFFGIMFSDAGYGLIMAIGCFLVLKLFELEGNTKKMITLFLYSGISTAIFGVLFGGFFGDLIGIFSDTFGKGNAAFNPVWFNPLDDPIKFLAFSLILGVIHLFVGLGIQMYMQIKDGHIWDAICDEGFWYFTIVGLGIWLFGGNIGLNSKIGMYLTIFGAAGLLLTGGRHKKGFGKITGGLSNIYNITSWLSDILSYARLLALGLATGVIAQVVNTMGAIFGGGALGLIFFVLVFAVGHVVNFAINALGAFIHAARLQYVEFFGKFYIDGGEPFKPYSYRTKYIRITEE